MTNPPHGGSVTPNAPSTPATGTAGSNDFGATTLSGRSSTNGVDAPAGTITDSDRQTSTSERPAERPPAADGRGLAGLAGAAGGSSGSGGSAVAAAAAGSRADATQTRTDLPPVPSATSVGTLDAPAPEAERPTGAAGAAASPSGIRGIRAGRNRGPRRARLQIRHINPVTVLKFSCILSIALFFVWLIAIGVLFGILDGAGVISNINDTVTQLNGSGSKPPVTAGIVFGGAAIIGVINIVLFIALSTIGAVIYNLCADLVGGIEITLSER